MDKTKNYQLNQWAAGDKVQRIDFNADNDKIDGAIAAVSARAGALETGKADKTALDAAKATIPKIAAGSYTGSGAASRTISLGFTPKAVLVMTQDGTTHSNNIIHGGLAVTGSPAQLVTGSKDFLGVSIVSSGFRVYYDASDNYYKSYANVKDRIYHYLAIG